VQRFGSIVLTPPNVLLSDAMVATFAPGLELLGTQALLPPFARDEMRGFAGANDLADLGEDYAAVWAELLERLLAVPRYVELLRAAYPGVFIQDFNFAHAANAIAAFEVRAFDRIDSPFERFVRGDDTALTETQIAGGLEFFGRAGCARCHAGALFTDQLHHNIGLPQIGPGTPSSVAGTPFAGPDFGRENVSGLQEDRYAFRTASLLDVQLTGPFGHAGQFANLRDFVKHYRDPELSNLQYDVGSNVSDPELVTMLVGNSDTVLASIDARLASPRDFDVDAVVEFLYSLTATDATTVGEVVPASVPSGLPVF
jgi:cytochrome c peroxidase